MDGRVSIYRRQGCRIAKQLIAEVHAKSLKNKMEERRRHKVVSRISNRQRRRLNFLPGKERRHAAATTVTMSVTAYACRSFDIVESMHKHNSCISHPVPSTN